METEDLLSKVGNNYFLAVRKLFERHLKIEEEELERKHGMYMTSPRMYRYTLSVAIPDGFKVHGLDNRTKKVETAQGDFVSSAVAENGKLIIKTKRYYNKLNAGKSVMARASIFPQRSKSVYQTSCPIQKKLKIAK